MDQEGGFIPQLLTHMGLTLESFRAAVRHEVELLPKVSGSGRPMSRAKMVLSFKPAGTSPLTMRWASPELLPKVSGSGREADKVYVAPGVDRALNQALTIAGYTLISPDFMNCL